jgi:hypothetical protein
MPAFEGLRAIRGYVGKQPGTAVADLAALIHRVEADAGSYDLEAALVLHEIVAKDAPYHSVGFYRKCLEGVLLVELPEWAKLVTLGRGRFIKRLKAVEFRDVRSLFRQAHLLDEPPQDDDVAWWDELQNHVRSHQSVEAMKRARIAERLTLDRERELLRKAGIDKPPRWMAIEDNTAGYDVLSYTEGQFGLLNKLIEVKSTIASPLRFYVSRNEWEQALEFGEAFVFHVWDLQPDPPILHERTVVQVLPHIPRDSEKGQWKNVLIPVNIC